MGLGGASGGAAVAIPQLAVASATSSTCVRIQVRVFSLVGLRTLLLVRLLVRLQVLLKDREDRAPKG